MTKNPHTPDNIRDNQDQTVPEKTELEAIESTGAAKKEQTDDGKHDPKKSATPSRLSIVARFVVKGVSTALGLFATVHGHGASIVPSEIATDADTAALAKMAIDKISTKNRVLNVLKTIASHVARIASSKPVGIIAQVVGAGLAIAAIASGGPITAGVAAGLALTSVVAKVAVDTVHARSFNKLVQENKRLVTLTNSIAEQKKLLAEHPQLSTALEGLLVKHEPKTEVLPSPPKHSIDSDSKIAGLSFGKAALKTASDIGHATLDLALTISGGIAAIVVKTGSLIIQGVSFGFLARDKTVDTLRNDLKSNINTLVDNLGIKYKNSRELKDQVRSQKIQTEALQQLTEELKSPTPPQDIKQRFQDLRREIEATEKAPNRNIFVRIGKAMFGVAKDVVRSQNPYSDYNNPGSFKIQKPEKSKETPELKQKSDSAKDLKEGTKDPKAVVETSVLENALKNKDPGLIESFRNKPKQQSVGIGK